MSAQLSFFAAAPPTPYPCPRDGCTHERSDGLEFCPTHGWFPAWKPRER